MDVGRLARALFLLLVVAIAGGAGDAGAGTRRLNLLIITADDMNADSPGWMGSKRGATPNLDRFAETTFRFEQCHVTAPICQPSRSALMTGRVPHRSGALGFDPIRPDVPTLVELIKNQGYHASVINKSQHMMPQSKFPWDLVLEGSGKDPDAVEAHMVQALRAARAAGKPFFINANITDPHRPFPGGVGEGDDVRETGVAARRVSREASKTMGARRARLEAPPYHVYRPAEVVVPRFLEDIPLVRQEVAQYFTAVARFDVSFGKVLGALEAAGHADDTLIVFLSDHGMSFPFSKATVYRNGTWAPVLLRWPGLERPGRDRDNLVSSVDILPTVLELLGIAPPAGLDGRSLVPLVRGESQSGRDHVVTHVNTVASGKIFPQRCVRSTTRSLVFLGWSDGKTTFRAEAMTGLSYRAMARAAQRSAPIKARVEQYLKGTPLSFFDLEHDPDERTNLIDDVRYRPEIERLHALLLAHMERTGDPELTSYRRAVAAWAAKAGPGRTD
jgi:N-sulfoglucosamine sulfohydrolase